MEKIIKKLNDKFEAFINDEGDNFIAGLVDYVEFVKERPETKNIIASLEEKLKTDQEKYIEARERDEKEQTAVSSVRLERIEHQNKNAMWNAWIRLNAIALGDFNIIQSSQTELFSSAKRFHSYLVDKLELRETSDNNEIDIEFDESKGKLRLNDKEIKFTKFSKQYNVLREMFRDEKETYKDWQLEEISDKMGEELFEWKKLYDVVGEIQRKIAAKTGKEDFFITTTQSVKINPKYTLKS